jgi:glutathione S-transferase
MKDIHPLGKSPIVTIKYPGVTQPRVLAESSAIMEHLLDSFSGGRLIPKKFEGAETFGGETESWVRYRYFMNYSEGSLFPLIFTHILMDGKCFPKVLS